MDKKDYKDMPVPKCNDEEYTEVAWGLTDPSSKLV
jgi:hypothetical protein